MVKYAIIKNQNPTSDELRHHGVKGMKWGVRKERYTTSLGNRKTSFRDDPETRKERIDQAIKEADDRVKFYKSKRAAKAAIKDEASYIKKQNVGKAVVDTMLYGGTTGVAASILGVAAAGGAAAGLLLGAVPVAVAAGTTAILAGRANNLVRKHEKAQIIYTEESEYGHDIVVTMKKSDT